MKKIILAVAVLMAMATTVEAEDSDNVKVAKAYMSGDERTIQYMQAIMVGATAMHALSSFGAERKKKPKFTKTDTYNVCNLTEKEQLKVLETAAMASIGLPNRNLIKDIALYTDIFCDKQTGHSVRWQR